MLERGGDFSLLLNNIKPLVAIAFSVLGAFLLSLSVISLRNALKLLFLFLAVGFGTYLFAVAGQSAISEGGKVVTEKEKCQPLDDFTPKKSNTPQPAALALCGGWPIVEYEKSFASKLIVIDVSGAETGLILSLGVLLMYINLSINVFRGPDMVFRAFLSGAALIYILTNRYIFLAWGNQGFEVLSTAVVTSFGGISYKAAMQQLSDAMVQIIYEAKLQGKLSRIERWFSSEVMSHNLADLSSYLLNAYSILFLTIQRIFINILPMVSAYFMLTGNFSPLKLIPVIMKIALISLAKLPLHIFIVISGVSPAGVGAFALGLIVLLIFMAIFFRQNLVTFFSILGTKAGPIGRSAWTSGRSIYRNF